jgi:hypothetical protein
MIASAGPMRRTLRRIALLSVAGTAMLSVYLAIGHATHRGVLVVSMPEWIPFLPIMTIPYLALLGSAWVLPLAIRDERRFHSCLLAGIFAYLLVAPWWVLWPSELPRPPSPAGWWNAPYRLLAAVDAPTNVMPCAHVLAPGVAAWFTACDRPSWRWGLLALLALGLPTIAVTWQHRPVDIALGLLAAALGIVLARCISRATRPATRTVATGAGGGGPEGLNPP